MPSRVVLLASHQRFQELAKSILVSNFSERIGLDIDRSPDTLRATVPQRQIFSSNQRFMSYIYRNADSFWGEHDFVVVRCHSSFVVEVQESLTVLELSNSHRRFGKFGQSIFIAEIAFRSLLPI